MTMKPVMVVFHSFETDWFLWRNSFTEHFCHDEDDDGSEKASASEKIYQGVTLVTLQQP
jgi:hypothetical protein